MFRVANETARGVCEGDGFLEKVVGELVYGEDSAKYKVSVICHFQS